MLDYIMINDKLAERHELLSEIWTSVTIHGDVIFNLENGETAIINIKDDLTNLPEALENEIKAYEAECN